MPNFIEEIIEKDLNSGKYSQIQTRFPPEPNGYLHIGHAKSICLNYYGTAVKYNGRFNLRFDDTNPSTEDEEYVNSILEDVRWLGCKIDKILYASDYFEIMYDCAVALIKKGKAYVCELTPEQIKLNRGTLTSKGTESPFRNRPIEESLKLFKDMRDGLVKDGELVLRAKIDMSSPNINMRDPIIYRVVHAHHHRQGDKWCIYPMYDFAHPIEDAVEHITHSICTLEFEDHRPLYDWVVVECGFDPAPNQFEFARLNLERTVMSKRYLKKLVDSRAVSGWDDPRMPTIAGLRRRGYTPDSIRDFCERVGVTKVEGEVEAALLESCIREELNKNSARAMVVLEPLELIITNATAEELDFEINPSIEGSGTRKIAFSNRIYIERGDFMVNPPPKYHRLTPDGMVRLKNAYIIRCTGYDLDSNGLPCKVYAELIEGTRSGSDTSGIKVKGVIHWVDADTSIDAQVRLYDYLLNKAEGEVEFSERLNPNSLEVVNAKAEAMLSTVERGTHLQFLRTGYFVRDIKEDGVVFNRVVGLKDSYKP